MTPSEWDDFADAHFTGDYAGQADDFQLWLRLRDCCPLDFSAPTLERLFQDWTKSRRRGKHRQIMNARRRRDFGPGRFWAATSSGVFLNKQFVKGWRGINPAQP